MKPTEYSIDLHRRDFDILGSQNHAFGSKLALNSCPLLSYPLTFFFIYGLSKQSEFMNPRQFQKTTITMSLPHLQFSTFF